MNTYWTSDSGHVEQLSAEDWRRPAVIVVWDSRQCLSQVALRPNVQHEIVLEMFPLDETVWLGQKRGGLRHGLWLCLPSKGYIEIVEYRRGDRRGFFARRGVEGYDFIGYRDDEGEYRNHRRPGQELADDRVQLTEALAGLVADETGVLGLDSSALPQSFSVADRRWRIDWRGSSLERFHLEAGRFAARITLKSLFGGPIWVADSSEGQEASTFARVAPRGARPTQAEPWTH